LLCCVSEHELPIDHGSLENHRADAM